MYSILHTQSKTSENIWTQRKPIRQRGLSVWKMFWLKQNKQITTLFQNNIKVSILQLIIYNDFYNIRSKISVLFTYSLLLV